MLDDAALIEAWVLHRSEVAFAQLVEQYQKLVLGAATRRIGNPELARDVAQQVFATLAAKAPMLMGRRNVAGWLYHVASYLGARALRSERRRNQVHSDALLNQSSETHPHSEHWSAIEEAVASLGQSDREVIVLHYLQDCSYPEIASALGISEAAARKRVSRGLQSLESRLRSRGIARSAAAVVAAVAAQQSATPASAMTGLAAGAITSSSATSTPLSLLINTLMTHTTTKLTAGIAAAFVIPLSLQWNANASLREEIANARQTSPVKTEAVIKTGNDRLAVAQKELASKRAAIIAAENRTAELIALKRQLETEVVYSMGTVESMARELARASRVTTALDTTRTALKKAQAKDAASEETKRLAATLEETAMEAATLMPRGIALIREVLKMERSPEKAARFYATFLAEAGGLDAATQAKLEARLQPWVEGLQQDGLALPQRPRTIERVQWDERRSALTTGFMTSLAAEFPQVNWQELQLDQHLGGGKDAEWFDMFLSEDDQS